MNFDAPGKPKPFSPRPPGSLLSAQDFKKRRGTLLHPSSTLAVDAPWSAQTETKREYTIAIRRAASVAHRLLSLPRSIRYIEISLSVSYGQQTRQEMTDLDTPPSSSQLVNHIRAFVDKAEFLYTHTALSVSDWAFIAESAYCEVYIHTSVSVWTICKRRGGLGIDLTR